MKTIQIVTAVTVAAIGVCLPFSANASLDQQKIFKGVFPGKDKVTCTTCHVAKLPKKAAHELNAYGLKASDAAGGPGCKPTAEIYKTLGDPDAAK